MIGVRKASRLTQADVARAVGVSRTMIVRYESGERCPPLDILLKLADFFGVSLDYLVGRTDRPEINRSADSPETDDPDPRR